MRGGEEGNWTRWIGIIKGSIVHSKNGVVVVSLQGYRILRSTIGSVGTRFCVTYQSQPTYVLSTYSSLRKHGLQLHHMPLLLFSKTPVFLEIRLYQIRNSAFASNRKTFPFGILGDGEEGDDVCTFVASALGIFTCFTGGDGVKDGCHDRPLMPAFTALKLV